MGIGRVESLDTAANIFVDMIESPFFVRPYLLGVSRNEIFKIMTWGMATIAGTMMLLYATILSKAIPGIMGHLLTASIISAPATVTVSKLMVLEIGEPSSENIKIARGNCKCLYG